MTSDDDCHLDIANLMATNTKPLDMQAISGAGSIREEYLLKMAAISVQSITSALFALESSPVDDGRLVELPIPITDLPREKPIPMPKQPTTWEKFAAKKGIRKNRRERLVYDDVNEDWRPRYGRNRANDSSKDWAVEHKEGCDPMIDPWSMSKAEKKSRVEHNKKKNTNNLKLAQGDRVAGTIDLASAVGRHNKRHKKSMGKNKVQHPSKGHVDVAFNVAANSTASMGVFDKKANNLETKLNAVQRAKGKTRSNQTAVASMRDEQSSNLKLLSRILNKSGDNAVTHDREKAANLHQVKNERKISRNKRARRG